MHHCKRCINSCSILFFCSFYFSRLFLAVNEPKKVKLSRFWTFFFGFVHSVLTFNCIYTKYTQTQNDYLLCKRQMNWYIEENRKHRIQQLMLTSLVKNINAKRRIHNQEVNNERKMIARLPSKQKKT